MIQPVQIKQAQVESVDDPNDAGRIKVKLAEDNNKNPDELPWVFPILPKYFQTPIAKGDGVFVLTSQLSNNESQRYYIGPIIPQPQQMEGSKYYYGKGQAIAALQGTDQPLDVRISNFSGETKGAFPEKNTTSILGRVSEDIILKDREIDIRCGIRSEATNSPDLKGKVVFNTINPAYIKLKHKANGKSYINLVADKINMATHGDMLLNNNQEISLVNQESLIDDDQLEKLSEILHPLAYGDVLVDIIRQIKDVFNRHTHDWANKPPNQVFISDMNKINEKEIESKSIRIS